MTQVSFTPEERPPAVAGLFYPDEASELRQQLRLLLSSPQQQVRTPKALIVPHAGYIYSGPVAASAYRALGREARQIRRVVLLGPSHRVSFKGLALSSASTFRTPLGSVPLDTGLRARVEHLDGVKTLDLAHESEHCLEVQLPFLQMLLEDFSILPVVVGRAEARQVADLLDAVWGGPETLIVISTDLSHYLDYDSATALDAQTSSTIERTDTAALQPEQACGYYPLRGLLNLAHRRQLEVHTLDLRNSGDTAGGRDRVVGYGSYAVYESD